MSIDDIGVRISEEMTKICEQIPERLNVVGILRDAHARFTAAAPTIPPEVIADKVVEVLREIAAHAVEQFERRTGQQFLWTEPEHDEPDDMLMSIGVEVKDGKGTITF